MIFLAAAAMSSAIAVTAVMIKLTIVEVAMATGASFVGTVTFLNRVVE